VSTLAVGATPCLCEYVTDHVTQCPEHFRLWRYGKRLASVSSIVRERFPIDPKIDPVVLENAKLRGSEVDVLFAAYCRGTLDRIPAGTREDAKELFFKVKRWFDAQNFSSVEVQVLLGDVDHGGVLDFSFDGIPYDLKATYAVDHSSRLQVAGYCDLSKSDIGRIIHVTERYASAAVIDLPPADHQDWKSLLAAWRVVQRRQK